MDNQFQKIIGKSGLFFLLILSGCMPKSAPATSITDTPAKASATEAVIRITNGEWIPYNSQYLSHSGCDSWAVSEAFALEGITVEYGFFPWARGYALAEDGVWDGAISWADTPGHREKFYISQEYTSLQEWVFFYRTAEPFDWQELTDLKGKRIGWTTGYVYSDAFNSVLDLPEMVFEEASNDQANFEKLSTGRIDIFPAEKRVGLAILSNFFTPEEKAQITFHPKTITEYRPHLLLSRAVPGNEELMKRFDAGWEKLISSGMYDEIVQQCDRMQVTPN